MIFAVMGVFKNEVSTMVGPSGQRGSAPHDRSRFNHDKAMSHPHTPGPAAGLNHGVTVQSGVACGPIPHKGFADTGMSPDFSHMQRLLEHIP
jgi:hypothetical protein